MAIRYGAAAIGLVSEMPSGPGVISEELISQITRTIPPPVSSFLLTSKQDSQAIIDQQQKCGVNTIQLCDRVEQECYRELRQALPGIALEAIC
jgi:phosphoribosylanthranilate isomerase